MVRLVGEVSEVTDKPGYKAVYFTVKDEKASLPCMMWMNRYQASGVALSVGALVELTGRFSLYAAKGRMNFDVFSVSLAGEGQLRLQVANLARELEAMGLMDPARKRPLPAYPEAIGLVTRRAAPPSTTCCEPAQAPSSGPHPVRRRSRGGPRGGRRARGRSGQGGLCRR
ncbi:MAG: exodeoxyribonuclease VII large subunit [Coriobacteriaceae bacterium]